MRLGEQAVHPHARGEYKSKPQPMGALGGSPPRTWGILVAVGRVYYLRRFTPTHVGNTAAALQKGLLVGGSPPRT